MQLVGLGPLTRAALAAAIGAAAVPALAAPALAAAGTRTAFTVTAEHAAYPVATPAGRSDTAAAPEVDVAASDTPVLRGGPACVAGPSTTTCPTVAGRVGPGRVEAVCQQLGRQVEAGGHTTSWWTWIAPATGDAGFVSNAYLTDPDRRPDVPRCAST